MERSVRGQTEGTLKWREEEGERDRRWSEANLADGWKPSVAKGTTATGTRDMGRVIAGIAGIVDFMHTFQSLHA